MSKKKKHDEYIERLKRFRWVQWQIVRRHEDYINFCDKQTFNKLGVLPEGATPLNIEEAFELEEDPTEPSRKIINPTIAILETSEKARSIKKRFFLNKVYDYSKDLSEDECLDICGWLKHVVPIRPKSKNFNAEDLPQYGDFIYVGINIADDVQRKDLKNQIYRHIDLMEISRNIQKDFRLEDIDSEISKLESFKGVSRQAVEPKINKLKEEFLNIKDDSSRTTPGKEQKLSYYEELFKIWDLYVEGNTAKEILKMIWPEEYKKEWGKTVETDDKKDMLYDKLAKKYRDQGHIKNWDERAFLEAYGNRNENMNSEGNRINLFMKIIHRRKRMEELFLMFPIS